MDPLPTGAVSVGGVNGTNNAIDPVPLNAKGDTSTTFVIVALALIIIATAAALKLIGHDIRGLMPARSQQRLDGPVAAPRLPAGANRALDRKP
jgi:hypothetical protein